MNTCLECGGDGISGDVSPRAASIVRAVFHLNNGRGGLARPNGQDWRGNVKASIDRSAWTCAGPLALVVAEANKMLERGFRIVEGDIPSLDYACDHCGGEGRCKHRCCHRAPESARRPSMARWMRNYGAMSDDKLRGCLIELEERFGDAYDRVRQHDGDLAEHIAKAKSIAVERELRRP